MTRAVAIALVAACGSRDASPADPPPPVPEPPDAQAFTGCPYQIYGAHLKPLADGALLIAPQSKLGSRAPQYAPEQRLEGDGRLTAVPAGTTHTERDHRLFLSNDGGQLCDATDCAGFELDAQLVAYDGYASAAKDPKGRTFVLTFTDDDRTPPELVVGFDSKGKRVTSWSSTKLCRERAELIVGGLAVMACRAEADPDDRFSRLAIRSLATGKLQSQLSGTFGELHSAVVDDTHFVIWNVETRALEAYDLTSPTRPRRAWTTPLAFDEPAIAVAAGGIVAIAREQPWEGVVLAPATGAVERRLTLDPCKR